MIKKDQFYNPRKDSKFWSYRNKKWKNDKPVEKEKFNTIEEEGSKEAKLAIEDMKKMYSISILTVYDFLYMT